MTDDEKAVLDAATQILAMLIHAGAKPSHVGGIGSLLLEHALVASDFGEEKAKKALVEVIEHLRESIENEATSITVEMVVEQLRKLEKIANSEHEEKPERYN